MIDQPYEEAVVRWRAEAEAALRADDGWLTVAGLFWLKTGVNRIGSDLSSDIVLPAGSAPDTIGSMILEDGRVTLEAVPEMGVTVNGKPVVSTLLRADADRTPDLVAVNDLTMFVIKRGMRVGVRLRDKNSPARQAFGGRHWFPAHEEYRVRATFVPYDPPKSLPIINILGDTEDTPSPGAVVFDLHGQEHRLDAAPGRGGGLFLIFRDLTSEHETYPAGRFLYTQPPEDGHVLLDFNRAVSPPCAFTDYATCPLPPRQNHLPLRIEAGEVYHHED